MLILCPACNAVLNNVTSARTIADVRERPTRFHGERYSVGQFMYFTLRCDCGNEQEIELYWREAPGEEKP